MTGNSGLSCITVKKGQLLEALKHNRQQHQNEYERAFAGYRTQVIKELKKALYDAEEDIEYRKHIRLEEPLNHIKDYDRIIKMLEMSIDEDVPITESEFAQYVMDDWIWKQQFSAQVQSYAGR